MPPVRFELTADAVHAQTSVGDHVVEVTLSGYSTDDPAEIDALDQLDGVKRATAKSGKDS